MDDLELKLHGVKALAMDLQRKQDTLFKMTRDLLGLSDDDYSTLSYVLVDFVYSDTTVEELLKEFKDD